MGDGIIIVRKRGDYPEVREEKGTKGKIKYFCRCFRFLLTFFKQGDREQCPLED